MTPEAKVTFSCGPMARRSVRAFLDYEGLQWTEHKSLLRSTFVARGTNEQVKLVLDTVMEWQRQIEARRA